MIALPAALAALVSAAAPEAGLSADDLACLALNVYHEARSEGRAGRVAVAHVTLNRAADPAFPSGICAVVTEGDGQSCQFSWWCDGLSDAPKNRSAFRRALESATAAASGEADDPTGGATYFILTDMTPPAWTDGLREVGVIGDHRFYKE
jgi:spore germination cell wall hydrolase CwlJ-like protein